MRTRSRFGASVSPPREDTFTRFPSQRPPPAEPASSGGLLGSLFGGLLKRPALPAPAELSASNEPSYEFVYNDVEDDGDKKTTVNSGTYAA